MKLRDMINCSVDKTKTNRVNEACQNFNCCALDCFKSIIMRFHDRLKKEVKIKTVLATQIFVCIYINISQHHLFFTNLMPFLII